MHAYFRDTPNLKGRIFTVNPTNPRIKPTLNEIKRANRIANSEISRSKASTKPSSPPSGQIKPPRNPHPEPQERTNRSGRVQSDAKN
uniref:Uncharacterized protein n=1 Tax=Arundo donax TaxID=35708 RepID=A0A0A9D9Q0_ARUDO